MIGRVGIAFLIAVVVGIILLAIFIFLVYKASKGGSWDCVKCKTQFTTWCTMCYSANTGMDDWSSGDELGNDLSNCVNECGYWSGATAGDDCTNAKDACNPFILYTE